MFLVTILYLIFFNLSHLLLEVCNTVVLGFIRPGELLTALNAWNGGFLTLFLLMVFDLVRGQHFTAAVFALMLNHVAVREVSDSLIVSSDLLAIGVGALELKIFDHRQDVSVWWIELRVKALAFAFTTNNALAFVALFWIQRDEGATRACKEVMVWFL